MPHPAPTLSGYNATPPPDDGSTVSSNQLRWSNVVDKIGDPLKDFATAINDYIPGAITDALVVVPDQTITARELASGLTAADIDEQYPELHVTRYGVTGDGTTNDTTKLLAAINVFRGGDSIVISGPLTAYEGGVLFFPEGTYVLDFDAIDITDILNLYFVGQGSRFEQDYYDAATKLLFTGTSAGFGIKFSGNGARNPQFHRMSIEYATSDFTGDLVLLEEVPGYWFNDVSLAHQITGAKVYSANSLIHLKGDTKNGGGQYVMMDDADEGLIMTAFGGNEPSSNTFLHWKGHDFATRWVNIPDGEARGNVFIQPTSNPILQTTSVDGMLLGGGWTLIGPVCEGADATKVPTNAFLDLYGNGTVIEPQIITNGTGIITRFVGEITGGGRIQAQLPIDIEVGSVLRKGPMKLDRLNSGTVACRIGQTSGSVVVDLAMDAIGSGFTNSYQVVTDNTAINGAIHYASEKDGSTNGPSLVSEHVHLERVNHEYQDKTASTYNVEVVDHGLEFTNAGAGGSVDFALPALINGLEYLFVKVTNQTITITRDGSNLIHNRGTAGVTTLTNAANEVGALVRLRAIRGVWVVVDIEGTWT